MAENDMPAGAQLSDDGQWWWDGSSWHPVAGQPQASYDTGTLTSGQLSDDGQWRWDGANWQPVGGEPGAAGPEGSSPVTDAASEEAQLATVDESQAQALAEAIAAYSGIVASSALEGLNLAAGDPEQMSAEDVRAECGPKGCDLSVTVGGEVFALVGCGDGTCPTCPPGMGNLIVRHWCAYVGVASQRSAIVLILAFGARLGPFLV